MVPNLVSGVWVGAEDRAAHFKTINYGQGASMALPIWALYMKKCYADKELNVSKADFNRPPNLKIRVDCSIPDSKKDSIPLQKKDDELDDLFK